MSNAWPLVRALRDPASVRGLDGAGWTNLVSMARAESLIGSLAHRLQGEDVPSRVRPALDDAIAAHQLARQQALWEADCARRALTGYSGKVVLMKGTAYVAAGLDAGIGRSIGDLDIMVAQEDLKQVEQMLLDAGWEWVKPDPYDDHYYREHMHELPPLIHRDRDRMIDVHHTTLPLTARPTPDPRAMLDAAVQLETGQYIMAPSDMVLHAVAHLFADGDLAGGLRNLWDIDRLITEFANGGGTFWDSVEERAKMHGLTPHLACALRLAARLYDTPVSQSVAGAAQFSDKIHERRLLARDGWGRETRRLIRMLFYIRSHWLRMPPLMLARHLFVKWRKGQGAT